MTEGETARDMRHPCAEAAAILGGTLFSLQQ